MLGGQQRSLTKKEQLSEMSRHSIEELGLSVRPIHALYRDGYSTIDKVAQMSEVDFSQMKGIGKKSIDEIKVSVSTWIKDNISYEDSSFQCKIVPEIEEKIQLAVAAIDPVMHLYWKRLYSVLTTAGSIEELDIRDGYELFYVIKSSLDMWHEKQLAIRCRRVPTIVLGDASEEDQAIGLLKEISPVAYFDYYEFYEERYGVRKESAQANPVIANALSAYYIDGQYIIDVPAIDERDVQQVLDALSEKSLWFIEDIENLFDRIFQYTPHDAINAAAFRRIGYTLNSSYVYCSSYGTALNFFEETVFSKDIVDLTSLDRRMVNLGMFAAALDKKKKTLEYIETAPKILMSIEKIRTVYDLSVEEIREIQSLMSVFYDEPFFNGRSIWAEVENLPIVQKLQGNDWMLTCIMRQQDAVASLSVAGGIILSLESASLNLSRICEWIASTHGKMSITNLEHTFNETFGTRIPASKLAEKLRTSGSWDAVVTDSMDEYIDSLVDAGLSDIDADDLLQEEFF